MVRAPVHLSRLSLPVEQDTTGGGHPGGTQVPDEPHVSGVVQVPHDVPHTGSGPHARPEQSGVHETQRPMALHTSGSVHVPHDWPQMGSVPHSIPPHAG